MYCTNCGAEIEPTDARCPYCGMLNPYGAEKEYMEKLEGIRKETASLGDMPKGEVRDEVKKSTKKILVIAGIVIGIIAALVITGIAIEKRQERKWEKQEREEMAFERKYFGELNELYEAGDDDAVMDFWTAHQDEKGSWALYDWEHSDYYIYYYPFEAATATARQIVSDGGPTDEFMRDDLGFGIYGALSMLFDYDAQGMSFALKGRDRERADAIRDESEVFLREDLHLDSDAQYDLYKSCCDKDGYLDSKLCRDARVKLFQ